LRVMVAAQGNPWGDLHFANNNRNEPNKSIYPQRTQRTQRKASVPDCFASNDAFDLFAFFADKKTVLN